MQWSAPYAAPLQRVEAVAARNFIHVQEQVPQIGAGAIIRSERRLGIQLLLGPRATRRPGRTGEEPLVICGRET